MTDVKMPHLLPGETLKPEMSLSLRDLMAIEVMKALLSEKIHRGSHATANLAYEYADAMIKARGNV